MGQGYKGTRLRSTRAQGASGQAQKNARENDEEGV